MPAELRVAESRGTIRLRVTAVYRVAVDELAGATIVPGDLRNVGQRGSLRLRIVLSAPIVTDGNAVRVLVVLGHKICATDIDGVGGGSIVATVDAEVGKVAFHRGAFVGASVSLGDEEGGA